MLVLFGIGCLEPFAEDRHDLESFRIAGVAVRAGEGEDELELRAFVYSGLGMWHEQAPETLWEVVSNAGYTTAAAAGVRITVPFVAPGEVQLTVSNGTVEESAVLSLDTVPMPPVVDDWTRATTDLTLADAALPIEDRAQATLGSDLPVEPGGSLRLSVSAGEATTHWMGTAGQFAELDASSTDWFAGTAEIDGSEVVASEVAAEGVHALAALTYDGAGGATWTVLDAAVGTPGPLLATGGRLFPVDATAGTGLFAATLQAADTTAGFTLADVVAVDDASASEGVCGASAGAPFDFSGIAEGVCGRDDVAGARIVVSGEVRP